MESSGKGVAMDGSPLPYQALVRLILERLELYASNGFNRGTIWTMHGQ
jgi:hypothetical protein